MLFRIQRGNKLAQLTQRYFCVSKKDQNASNDFKFNPIVKKSNSKKKTGTKTGLDKSTDTSKFVSSKTSSKESEMQLEQNNNNNNNTQNLQSAKFKAVHDKIYANSEFHRKTGYIGVKDWLDNGGELDDFVSFETRKYPDHIEHWNKSSPNYVPSHRLVRFLVSYF